MSDVYPALNTPESWSGVASFAEWYLRSGMPILPPWDAPVIQSDDATAICLYRKGQFQVELYLILPGTMVPMHAHPGMETLLVNLGGGGIGDRLPEGHSSQWCVGGAILADGKVHGDGAGIASREDGFAMLAFQHWLGVTKPTSAAVQWCGNTAGPLQDKLIESYYPNAQTMPGFADVRAKKPKPIL